MDQPITLTPRQLADIVLSARDTTADQLAVKAWAPPSPDEREHLRKHGGVARRAIDRDDALAIYEAIVNGLPRRPREDAADVILAILQDRGFPVIAPL